MSLEMHIKYRNVHELHYSNYRCNVLSYAARNGTQLFVGHVTKLGYLYIQMLKRRITSIN